MTEDLTKKQSILSSSSDLSGLGSLASPKNGSRPTSSTNLVEPFSPTRSSERRLGYGPSPDKDDNANAKRYEQLAKICNQMRDKENELNDKAARLADMNQKHQNLEYELKRLQEEASKKEGSGEVNTAIQAVKETLNQRNEQILIIYKDIQQLAADQSARVSSDEATIAGIIRKITSLDSDLNQSQKKSAVATTKLLYLQSKVLGDVHVGMTPEQQNKLQSIDEFLQKSRAQLNETRQSTTKLTGNLEEAKKKSAAQASTDKDRQAKLKKYKEELEASLKKLKYQSTIADKQKELQNLKAKAEATAKYNLYKVKAAVTTADKKEKPKVNNDKLEELKKKLKEVEKEHNTLAESNDQDTKTLANINSEIQELKSHKPAEVDEHPEVEAQLVELRKGIDNMKKYKKKLNDEQSDLKKDAIVTELEDLKKKYAKRGKYVSEEGFDKLQAEKEKIQKYLNALKNNISSMMQQNNDKVPAKLIDDYKQKVETLRKYVTEISTLSKENEQLQRYVKYVSDLKETVEWEKNPKIEAITKDLEHGNLRLNDLVQQNKDLTKRVAATNSKLQEYQAAYPEFELPKKKGKNYKAAPAPTPVKKDSKTEKKEEEPKNVGSPTKKKKSKQFEVDAAVIEEVIIVEPEPKSPEIKTTSLQTKESKKKGKKTQETYVESPVANQQKDPSPTESERLKEIYRKILEEPDEYPEETVKVQKKPFKKASKGQKGKKAQSEYTLEEPKRKIPTSLVKEETNSNDGYKTFVLPVAVVVLLAVVYSMMK